MLRFSRLFRPVHVPHIWKKKKKKKVDSSEKESSKDDKSKETAVDAEKEKAKDVPEVEVKTEVKDTDSHNSTAVSADQIGGIKKEITEEPSKPASDLVDGTTVEEVEMKPVEEDYWPYKLNLGRDPKPEECMPDDAVCIFPLTINSHIYCLSTYNLHSHSHLRKVVKILVGFLCVEPQKIVTRSIAFDSDNASKIYENCTKWDLCQISEQLTVTCNPNTARVTSWSITHRNLRNPAV